MNNLLVETKNVSKCYDSRLAVNRVNLKVERGAIYGLIGRNGAGKTTIMKMICGLARPTAGDIMLFGKERAGNDMSIRRIGALIENPGIYTRLSAYDNIKLKCIAYGIPDMDTYIKGILETVGLADTGDKKAGKFSLGMRQRLGVALALVGEPDICVLDEPINGLDPQGIAEIRELIYRLNKERGITFIVSSHILGELDKVATHIGIIHNGILLEELTSEELHAKCSSRIEICSPEIARVSAILEENGYKNYKVITAETVYLYDGLDNLRGITLALINADIPFTSIGICKGNLEDYFLQKCGGDANA